MMPATPQLRVLKYQEDGEWVAHLLEMDLVGVGETPEQAEQELMEALEAQLSYCVQNAVNPFHPAPQEFFDRWDQAQKDEFVSFVLERDAEAAPNRQRARFLSTGDRSAYRTKGWRSQLCPG